MGCRQGRRGRIPHSGAATEPQRRRHPIFNATLRAGTLRRFSGVARLAKIAADIGTALAPWRIAKLPPANGKLFQRQDTGCAPARIWKCAKEATSGRDLIAFRRCCGYRTSVSLTEIEEAVKKLSREELAKLAAFIARQDKLVWDEELEEDFSPGGKHAAALEKIDAEISAGKFRPMP